MLPDRVSNPGPLTYESGALPIALRGPALIIEEIWYLITVPYFFGYKMEVFPSKTMPKTRYAL